MYAIKECFLTLQGEGAQAGAAAVFVRFAGCNLWSGLETDRATARGPCGAWCDTDFVGTDGPGGGRYTAAELAAYAEHLWRGHARERRLLVCTGGEPLLQLDAPLVAVLHERGFSVAVETNGTLANAENAVGRGVDWVTVSPKFSPRGDGTGRIGHRLVVTHGDELKLVFPQVGLDPEVFAGLRFPHFFLQPMAGPDLAANTALAIEYVKAHPKWRLSVQVHKLVGIP